MHFEHYGLSGPPFQLTPDARFWFDSRTHKKAMAYLGYGLAQGEGFIVITGEIGAGKSTLAGHLLAKIDRSRLNAIDVVSTQVEGDDLLRLVAQRFGIAADGVSKASLLDRVEQALEEEYRGGKRTLILVDEAQNLPVSALEELRMLSNFQIGGRALVQILLLGQPEFRERLAGEGLEQLRQRVIAFHHLEPMGADEIEAYVGHRLALVGWSGRPDFTQDCWQALFIHTGGLPRKLNQLLNRLMLHGAVESLERFDAASVETVAADLAVDHHATPEQPVLPLHSARPAPEPVQAEAVAVERPHRAAGPDPLVASRIAALEGQLAEQEVLLRRVLTLLVDWAEAETRPWDQRTERRTGPERRFHAV